MHQVLQVAVGIFNPLTLFMLICGTAIGVFVGAVPGLNGAVGVALLLPLSFGLSPENSLLLLGGIYMGSQYGGSITAILLNAPGDVVNACTAIEGFPLARQGRAKEALYVAILACVFGGLTGVLVLILFTPLLASFALKFGPAQMFLVTVAGLTMAGALTARNVVKGLFGVVFGVILSTVGVDPLNGSYRLTFGINQLKGGIPLIPVILGLFAISQMIINAGQKTETITDVPPKNITLLEVIRKILKKIVLLLKSSFLGTFIGVLPATGGAVATFVSYAEAKRASKVPELFGKGNIEGIIASESANNAAVGGSMVPLLALGVPGSTTSAIMYGALTIHGLIPGPRLFIDHAHIAYTFVFGMLLTVVFMAAIGIGGIPFFARVAKLKLSYVVPVVLAFCIIGAYSIRNDVFDVVLATIFGIIGVGLNRVNIPPATIVMGLILGPILEKNLRRALIIAHAKGVSILVYMFSSLLSLGILVVVLLLLFSFYRISRRGRET